MAFNTRHIATHEMNKLHPELITDILELVKWRHMCIWSIFIFASLYLKYLFFPKFLALNNMTNWNCSNKALLGKP